MQPVRDEIRNRKHVVRAHARREQRLMRVAKCRVRQQQAGSAARVHSANFSGPSSIEQLPGAGRRRRRVVRRDGSGLQVRRLRLAGDFFIAVDRDLAEIRQQLRRAVAPLRELEQLRRVVQESCRGFATLERRGDSPRSRGTECSSSRRGCGTRAARDPCAGMLLRNRGPTRSPSPAANRSTE